MAQDDRTRLQLESNERCRHFLQEDDRIAVVDDRVEEKNVRDADCESQLAYPVRRMSD